VGAWKRLAAILAAIPLSIAAQHLVESRRGSYPAGGERCVDLYIGNIVNVGGGSSGFAVHVFERWETAQRGAWGSGVIDMHSCICSIVLIQSFSHSWSPNKTEPTHAQQEREDQQQAARKPHAPHRTSAPAPSSPLPHTAPHHTTPVHPSPQCNISSTAPPHASAPRRIARPTSAPAPLPHAASLPRRPFLPSSVPPADCTRACACV
jgi:hypothetical protein